MRMRARTTGSLDGSWRHESKYHCISRSLIACNVMERTINSIM